MKPHCWFCNSEENLRVHERSYDSAPYLNDDGSLQMICEECVNDIQDYRQRVEYEMQAKQRALLGALSTMSDRDYASWAEWEERKENERDR